MNHHLRSQRLGALFAGGWMLLNFPLLALWDRDLTLAGIPLFPLALFLIWAGLIATVAWWMESPPPREMRSAAPGADREISASDVWVDGGDQAAAPPVPDSASVHGPRD